MSQKKAKLLRKFIKVTGKERSGAVWSSQSYNKNGDTTVHKHVLLESKRLKRAYKEASHKQKSGLSSVMLIVIKNSNDKTNKIRV